METKQYKVTKPAPPREEDRYDRAVAYLTAHPDQIEPAWDSPRGHIAGCLFQYAKAGSDGKLDRKDNSCGCLTKIRLNVSNAYTDDMTHAIRADTSIPYYPSSITVESLPIFAKWQRILDVEYRRLWEE